MLKALGKKITNNLSLKLLAALAAIVVWIVIVNIDDPLISLPYTTSVTAVNTDYIASLDKYFEPLDSSNTVTFRASAKRSIMSRIVRSDFTATADMEKIEYDEASGNYRVPVSIVNTKYSTSQVTISAPNAYMEVTLEDLGRTQKTIVADTKGSVADGCALGDVTIVGSNLLKISGPSSVVSQIETVSGTINVDGMSQDVTDSVVPTLYDANGEPVDTTKLTLSINTVTVAAQILNTKDVTVEISTLGNPSDGYMMTGIEYLPSTVRIKGDAAVLNPISKITVPADVLSLTGATADIDTTIDISAYLPVGTALVLASDAMISVRINIEPIIKQTYDIPVSRLSVLNLRDGYRAEFGVDTVTVEIAGAESAMASFSGEQLRGTLDASDLNEGLYNLAVNFELDESKYQTTASVEVPVQIIDQVPESTGEHGPASDAGQTLPEDTSEASLEAEDTSERR